MILLMVSYLLSIVFLVLPVTSDTETWNKQFIRKFSKNGFKWDRMHTPEYHENWNALKSFCVQFSNLRTSIPGEEISCEGMKLTRDSNPNYRRPNENGKIAGDKLRCQCILAVLQGRYIYNPSTLVNPELFFIVKEGKGKYYKLISQDITSPWMEIMEYRVNINDSMMEMRSTSTSFFNPITWIQDNYP